MKMLTVRVKSGQGRTPRPGISIGTGSQANPRQQHPHSLD